MQSSSEPLGSPLEVLFLATADKYLNPAVTLLTQVKIETAHGAFRVDTVLESSGSKRVAIELDGFAFHNAEVDAWRDAAILDQGAVGAVIRIRGKDLCRYPFLVWWIVAKICPWSVTRRSAQVLARQVELAELGDLFLETGPDGGYADFLLPSPDEDLPILEDAVSVLRRARTDPTTVERIQYLHGHPHLHVREVSALVRNSTSLANPGWAAS